MICPARVHSGEGLGQRLRVDLNGGPRAGGVGQKEQPDEPIQERFCAPGAEWLTAERVRVSCLKESCGWMFGRLEVTGHRFASCE